MATPPKDQDHKVRENRLRRVAERRGLKVEKVRRRDPHALDYGQYRILRDGQPIHHAATLDDVETYLNP